MVIGKYVQDQNSFLDFKVQAVPKKNEYVFVGYEKRPANSISLLILNHLFFEAYCWSQTGTQNANIYTCQSEPLVILFCKSPYITHNRHITPQGFCLFGSKAWPKSQEILMEDASHLKVWPMISSALHISFTVSSYDLGCPRSQ